MLSLPFKDETFNGVLALQSLEYIPIIPIRLTRRVLAEIYRVLKPHGIVLFSLEKTPGSEIDKDFNYIYEDVYVKVKKHFIGVGVGRDLGLLTNYSRFLN